MSEMPKKLGVTDFVSEIERVKNYPDFEKLAPVIQHSLRRFEIKNIEGKSTEANDPSHTLKKWVGGVNNFLMLSTFSQNLTLQEAFETAAKIKEELKIMEKDDPFRQKIKLEIDSFYSFFR